MQTILVSVLTFAGLFLASNRVAAQTLSLSWQKKIGEKVSATPVHYGDMVLIGNDNGVFYALDLKGGEEIWHFETGGNIQARALIVKDQVFFESANKFYLLDAKTGNLKWEFDSEMTPFNFQYQGTNYLFKIDPFDDKRSGACFDGGQIFVGCGNGKLYAMDAETGKVSLELNALDNAPIRSSPLVHDGKLYFGDWNGIVYCYNLATQDYIWIKKTYRGKRPYPTFGGVVSEFLLHRNLLYFGARNHMMNVLYEPSGEKEWTFTDPDGGWIVGDPVIYKDTLYIGGSDNFSMYAFQPENGRLLWKQNGGKNIYTKPLVTEKFLLYTAGNGYNPNDLGKTFLLNRKNGEVLDEFETDKGIFSSPVLINGQVLFGCFDGRVYCLRIEDGN